jgi:hypothetical protein
MYQFRNNISILKVLAFRLIPSLSLKVINPETGRRMKVLRKEGA